MARKRILSIMLVFLMLVANTFWGMPQTIAQAGSIKTQFDSSTFIGVAPPPDPSTYFTSYLPDGRINMTSSSTSGNINSKGVVGYFSNIPITGDFKISATVTLSSDSVLAQKSEQSLAGLMAKTSAVAGADSKDPMYGMVFRPYRATGLKDGSLWGTTRTQGSTPGDITGAKCTLNQGSSLNYDTPVKMEMQRTSNKITVKYSAVAAKDSSLTKGATDTVMVGDSVKANDNVIGTGTADVADGTTTLYVGLFVSKAAAVFSDVLIVDGNGNTILDPSYKSTPSQGSAPAPASVSASVYQGNKIDIDWFGQDLATDSSTSYLIETSKDNGATYSTVAEYTYSAAKISSAPFEYIYTPSASGNYLFRVTGKAGANSSSAVTTATAVNYVLPLAKPELTVSMSDGIVNLSWKTVTEAVYYDVSVYDSADKVLSEFSQSKIEAPATSTTVKGLTNGAVYKFSVTARRDTSLVMSDISAPITYAADVIPTVPVWQSRIFGNSVSPATNIVTVNDSSVTIESNKGKISGNTDGIAYYYTPLDSTKPFQLSAKVHIDKIYANGGNNQVAFGLMLRNTVGADTDTSGHLSNFVAVGGVYQKMQAFSRADMATLSQNYSFTSTAPKAGEDYTLTLTKTEDNKCIVTCGTASYVVDATNVFSGTKFYAGVFAARDVKVTFSDINLVMGVSSLELEAKPAKTEYLLGQSLDMTGLKLTAKNSDSTTKALSSGDYVVSGYDPNKLGNQTVYLYYGGKSASFDVNVNPLTCTSVELIYTPAKTTYYLNDKLDTLGMAINGTFNSGLVRALDASEYTVTGFDSTTPGVKTVTVSLNENPDLTVQFNVTIKDSVLQGLEIIRNPSRTIYYLGENLDLTGLVVSEIYNDSKQVLQSGDYTVDSSAFDNTKAGTYNIVISSKDKKVNLTVTVKEKELTGIEITNYPKTTFYKGDVFDSTGIIISKTYDNGDKENLTGTEYKIDSSAFNNSVPGAYQIVIIPVDSKLKSITYSVTVREQTAYVWKSIEFGQSTSPTNNVITPSNPGTTEGTIVLKAGSVDPATTGGKVTSAHDGISYYYTEIDGTKDNFELSADIKVIEFAKVSPDNQEAFGIMARDAIGVNGNNDIFSSNVAAVGGYRGTTQAFIRTGVTSYLGNEGTVQTATSWATKRPDSTNTGTGKYRLTLKKTNSGYTASLNNLADNTVTFYQPDALIVQDSKIYVGFYTARVATIEVSNVDFKVTAAETDAPKVTPPQVPVTPGFRVTSLSDVSKSDYVLTYIPNVDGLVTIKQGENIIVSDLAVKANQTYQQTTNITANDKTNFTITFTPDALQTLSSYDRIITNFSVNMKTYQTSSGDIYVSPTGTSAGTGEKTSPLDIDTAIKYVKEGQTIYLMDGTYLRSSGIRIPAGNNGTAGAMKTLSAASGAKVILDFNNKGSGLQVAGDYWHIYGIDSARANGVGIQVGGNHNIIELCRVYENTNTGMQISRIGSLTREYWPSYNLILNCEAFDNKDASENNADGFAAKLTSGEGNVFRGCISHNNIDDGWDLYTKAETGPIGAVIIEDCIAYNNGILTNGYLGKGDKNGFKLGGEGIAVKHVIKNSIAFGNGAAGFTSNSNPAVQAENNVSFNNTGSNISFSSYDGIPLTFKISKFVSYRNDGSLVADEYPSNLADIDNYFYDGTKSVNKYGKQLADTNFLSLTPSLPYERDVKGNIIFGNFLEFILNRTSGGGAAAPIVVPTSNTSGSADVTPSTGGTVGLGSDAKVVIPAGALNGSANLAVKVEKISQQPAAPENAVFLSPVYNFTVGGENNYKFASKVTITLNFDPSLIKGDNKPSIYYYDEAASKWVELGGTVSGSTISVDVDHFTKFTVLASADSNSVKPAFNDISGHWAQSNIDKLVSAGAVSGYPDGSFQPDSNITRAEFVTILVKAFKLDVKGGKVFNDTADHWAKDYISTAAQLGIVKGYDDGNFGADDCITREQMTAMIINAAKLTASGEPSFTDNSSISDWAKSYVAEAVKEGIVKGYEDNSFRPQANATRAEAVTVIINALNIKK